jgi:hypothetical protein
MLGVPEMDVRRGVIAEEHPHGDSVETTDLGHDCSIGCAADI